jgi:hypothetical protein
MTYTIGIGWDVVARVARPRNPGPSLTGARSRVASSRNPGYATEEQV